jgi:hypothetical protein
VGKYPTTVDWEFNKIIRSLEDGRLYKIETKQILIILEFLNDMSLRIDKIEKILEEKL